MEKIAYKMDVALYNSSQDSTFATGFVVAFTLGALAAMQKCAPQDDDDNYNDSEPEVKAPPPSRTSSPISQPRAKKVTEEMAAELKPMILDYLQSNPASSAKAMLNAFSREMPEVTKTNINSCLYTMLHKKQVRMNEEGRTRLWFVK